MASDKKPLYTTERLKQEAESRNKNLDRVKSAVFEQQVIAEKELDEEIMRNHVHFNSQIKMTEEDFIRKVEKRTN